MNLYIDLDRSVLVSGPSNSAVVTQLAFKRGDTAALAVTFLQGQADGGYLPVVLPTGTAFKFGLKAQGQYSGAFLVYTDAWTAPAGEATAYGLCPDFRSASLDTLLDPEGAGDLPQVSLMGEIAWTLPSGRKGSTRTFTALVANDLIKDTEGAPAPATPGYYTAGESDARYLPSSLGGIVDLTVGLRTYTVDLTALALPASPRGALFGFVAATGSENTFGAVMVSSQTTATTLSLLTTALPDAPNCRLAYLLIL
ncbi:hypothetical protein SAMN05444156_0106 [Verrucomicrobium sp. GAS474]|uniref:hypothetical protein n=1 Tax=Verrucomicrobium sp. GAS474 TaxID=1882831 RepID=UPI00087C52BA|nr:hypothetical protein [Verrucomicrobium sp. GAS474]SDT86038.1 hypothetical protein SAMN05444156_0106 [Verrucomicrobium sp. GAS474]